MVKKAVQQGRSERRDESYSLPYVEPLSDARTLVADFFNTLLVVWRLDLLHRREGFDYMQPVGHTEREEML